MTVVIHFYIVSRASAAFLSSSFNTSAYIFNVVCISACPKRSEIVLTSTPEKRRIVACVCLKS